MDLRQLRLYIEHCALPELFFEHKEDLLAKIIREEGKVFADMFQRAVDIEYAGATSPYTEDDFKIVPMRMKDKRYSLHITLPEPEAPPECESIIMCYKISKKGLYDLHYFTSKSIIHQGTLYLKFILKPTPKAAQNPAKITTGKSGDFGLSGVCSGI